MGPYSSSLLLIFVFVGINCMELTTHSNNTMDWPDLKVLPERPATCSVCICNYGKINCYGQNLVTYFSFEKWEDIATFRPKIVDLGDNALTRVTPMPILPIEELNLTRNRIEDIEYGSFQNLQYMRVLDLSFNKLTGNLSPKAFIDRFTAAGYKYKSSMRVLNLAYNDFHSLNQYLFIYIPDLTSLDLSGNPLTAIQGDTLMAISMVSMLKDLKLRSCQLSEIPDRFLNKLEYLEHLDLSDNQLTMVPQQLRVATNLIFLNLNQNPILELHLTNRDALGFPKLSNLQELHMCNMPKLRSIGLGALAGLENLSKIHMSSNPKLEYIDPKALMEPDGNYEIYETPIIKELYLQDNKLSGIDSDLLAHWDLLEKVDVSNNPFFCDCANQWMVDILVPIIERIEPNESEKLVCQEPYGMKGYTMKYIHDTHSTLRCDGVLDGRLTARPMLAIKPTVAPAYQLETVTDSILPDVTQLAVPLDLDEEDDYLHTGLLIGVPVVIGIVLFLVVFWKLDYFGRFRGRTQKAPVDDVELHI